MKSLQTILKNPTQKQQLTKLKNLLNKPSIVFITGPPKSGKSTLIDMIKDITLHNTILIEPRLNHTQIHHNIQDGNLLVECQLDYTKLPGLIKSDISNIIQVTMEPSYSIKSIDLL